jgi:DNA-binding beta-propeller fold protein YncE
VVADEDHSAVIGLVPTGWYPTGVGISKDGRTWYIANAKSEPVPNANWCQELDPATHTCMFETPPGDRFAPNGQMILRVHDQATLQTQHAEFLTLSAPAGAELARLTQQVARNNHFDDPDKTARDEQLFSFLRTHITHVMPKSSPWSSRSSSALV